MNPIELANKIKELEDYKVIIGFYCIDPKEEEIKEVKDKFAQFIRTHYPSLENNTINECVDILYECWMEENEKIFDEIIMGQ